MRIRFLNWTIPALITMALVAGCGGNNEVAGLPSATITATSPANLATNVPTNALTPAQNFITATFSKTMQASSINANTFYATYPGGTLPGTVKYSNLVGTLTFANPLPQKTLITATITTGAADNGPQARPGHAPLSQNYVWTFTTGTNDAVPTILSTTPANLATGVSPSTAVSVNFSKAMNPASLNPTTFTFTGPAGPSHRPISAINATVTYANNIATLSPTTPLAANSVYTATVTTGATDLAGTTLGSKFSWTFTTAVADIAPTITSFSPSSGATGVSISTKITATFSEAMNPASITAGTFTLQNAGGTKIIGSVSYSNNQAVLLPSAPLTGSTVYTAQVNTGATDVAGTALGTNKTWSFTTASTDIAPTVIAVVPGAGSVGISTSGKILATFSESMNASTITSAHFYLTGPGNTVIPATVTYANDVASLNPTVAMASNTLYTATVTTGVTDVAGTPMAVPKVWTFTTATTDIAPTVLSTVPAALATKVPLNSTVSATFSEAMNSATISVNHYYLTGPGTTAVPATVSYANNIALLTPTNALLANTVYTATITTGVNDVAGTSLVAAKTWTFTTSDIAPTVISTTPLALATAVPVNTSITATFSEAMTPSTINGTTIILNGANGLSVPVAISYANNVATLVPKSVLAGNAVYKVTINTGVKNTSGTAMVANKIWTFTTVANGTVPTVISTNPANNATNVFLNQAINATFSEPMLASSLNITSFTVNGVTGSVVYYPASNIAGFIPSTNLAPNTKYTAKIQVWAQDLRGNDLTNTYTWSFTTGTLLAQTQVNLGSAGTFGVLAGSTVTNGGPTIVNGNLGVSPGTAVTGFPPGTVTGTIHSGDAIAAQAKADLLQGQLDAAGRLGAQALPGDLSGLTIYPGLYKNSTSVMISSGHMTFDAQGDPSAVFVLQMGSTLTTGTGTGIVLAGGAQASNIYWSVGSSATLGVNSVFVGTLLAQVSITANTGCTVQGVLLTDIGAVTMQSNTITPKSRRKVAAPNRKRA